LREKRFAAVVASSLRPEALPETPDAPPFALRSMIALHLTTARFHAVILFPPRIAEARLA
jgi:hypothetical protein